MHDFDYDAMQKKRIAQGAKHMKRGSKSKKCSLPSDRLTPAQLRRMNGPVSTYKLDEPMNWESFKAMPEDLQKQYIIKLQETYQATDGMLCKMFDRSIATVLAYRKKLGVDPIKDARIYGRDKEIREAKWDAFCNGVVGGKPGEVCDKPNDEPNIPSLYNDDAPFVFSNDPNYTDDPAEIRQIKDMLENLTLDIYRPEELNLTFISEDLHAESINKMIRQMVLPEGKCRIKISIEKV